MKVLNLVHKEESDIKYDIFKFPDGEVQITLGEFSHKEDYIDVKCRITNAEELFIVCQVCDIFDRHAVNYMLSIYYLMSMRMDRVMEFNRPFTLKIVMDMLWHYNASSIRVLEPHSEVYRRLNPHAEELFISTKGLPPNWVNCQIVYPDKGASERYSFHYSMDLPVIQCSKERNISTGKITSIKIDNPQDIKDKPLLIIDDLCDGGGTFCGIAKAFEKVGVSKDRLNISIIHMVNAKGIENLSKHFNHVWFTNSYKDWNNLPDNVTLINLI